MKSFMSQPQGNLDSMVRESLRQKIISGELDGGFHLSELKISKEYNVSRTPVREALCALAADGLVEMVPHRGAFVAHAAPHSKTDQLTVYTLLMGLAAKMAAEKAAEKLKKESDDKDKKIESEEKQKENDNIK